MLDAPSTLAMLPIKMKRRKATKTVMGNQTPILTKKALMVFGFVIN
jgi:hypothetical protein